MASGNTVEVKFAGEASGFNRVVKQVAENSEESAGRMSKAFDGAGNAADGAEGKFMGMADLLDGLGGAFGIPTEGATNMMRSMGDLSGGFATLQPFIGGVTSSMKAMGLSMLTNPIFLVIAGVVALGAALYFAYTRSETFREIVDAAFRHVAAVGMWVFNVLFDNAKRVFDYIAPAAQWIGGVLAGAFQGAWGTIKTIFNAIASGWNNTLGKLTIRVPDIPGVPFRGQSFNVPDIPMLAKGGIVNSPTLAMIGEAGPEAVVPLGRGGGVGPNVSVTVQGNVVGANTRELRDLFVALLDEHFGRGGALTDGRGGTLRPSAG